MVSRKTSPRTEPIEAESEHTSGAASQNDPVPGAGEARREPEVEAGPASEPVPEAAPEPEPQVGAEPPSATGPSIFDSPLSSTQLLNDPLLGTHDEIILDLGVKLRWAAVGYALLGVVASWLLAAQVGVATKDAAPFGWALAATIVILAGAAWYLADVWTRFASVAAYRRAKTPQAIARLDRGSVVGLYGVIGAWIGGALGALVVVDGTVSAVLTLALGASGWVWFFGAVPALLLYLYGFVLLHYRLLEKTRDALT